MTWRIVIAVPKLWSGTLEAHKREVRDAVISSTTELVAAHGLRGVTMSRIAEQSGIGRATLYKYFPDVDSILAAWHESTVRAHLEEVRAFADGPGTAEQRLHAMLRAYGLRMHEQSANHAGSDLAAMVHRGDHVDAAHRELTRILTDAVRAAVHEGVVRRDIAPGELANFCVNALSPAARTKASVERAVELAMSALRPG